jgi:hypothetical protein
VYFVENCLLHFLFRVEVQHPSSTIFHLHHPHTLTADVLPKGVIKSAPEGFILFAFNNSQDLSFCGFVCSILCCFEAIRQVLPPVALSVLPKVITLLLADHHAQFDILNSELKWSIDLTSSCGAA